MPVTTDYQVFAERYHFPSEMEAREQKDEMIAKLQASEANLQAELELSRSFNERFRNGHELCEVYKGQCEGMKVEIRQLREQAEDDDFHIQWVYDNTGEYEDWIRGSDIFQAEMKENEDTDKARISVLKWQKAEMEKLSVQLDTACEAFKNEQKSEYSEWSEDFDMTFHDLINQRTE